MPIDPEAEYWPGGTCSFGFRLSVQPPGGTWNTLPPALIVTVPLPFCTWAQTTIGSLVKNTPPLVVPFTLSVSTVGGGCVGVNVGVGGTGV